MGATRGLQGGPIPVSQPRELLSIPGDQSLAVTAAPVEKEWQSLTIYNFFFFFVWKPVTDSVCLFRDFNHTVSGALQGKIGHRRN